MSVVGARGLETIEEAEEQIKGLIRECEEGRNDCEAEAIEIAQTWELNEEWVKKSFADARLTAKLAAEEKVRRQKAKPLEVPDLRKKFVEPAARPKIDLSKLKPI